MSDNTIIFDLKYTSYLPDVRSGEYRRQQHAAERAFYDMSGKDNILKYITTEEKQTGNYTMLEYLKKNTGVFNANGVIPDEEVAAMKERAQHNKGFIWHGFISFNKDDSEKINMPDKCIRLVKKVFTPFFKEAGFNPNNIDLMCALHLDRPHHLHIHFVYWEKEPKYKDNDGTLRYRKRGKTNETAIDNMYVRLGLFIQEEKDNTFKSRNDAVKSLRKLTDIRNVLCSKEKIKKEILSLSKDLPSTGRLSYGSKDIEPFRGRVDNIVKLLLLSDRKALKADERFYKAVAEKREMIHGICNQGIDESKIKIIEKIEEDYKRRQGNIVLNLCKFVKPEYFERKKNKRYKANDNKLKKRLTISKRNVDRRIDSFILTFGKDLNILEREYSDRLRETEEEFEQKRKEEKEKAESENYNYKG